ncbi:hypothetical protein [Tepidibacter thalassicus]|uniref:Uncharacterized protein n=1 Tax=Tepidibacter thalassicus DSM 15285 TaxID=1123350 RepID=A0A1M5RZH5_9FIRM|nr:hypothetical protein [Tepidibacter thalassicus]SHH31777.1 hypothetical protein SAMN02744040_01575 [Tepidibacter thalassicus DSM 15285]
MFIMKNNCQIERKEIYLVISKLLIEVIETNKPYIWYKTEEPFINKYNGRISYDYSGEVREMTYTDIIKMKNELGKSEIAQILYFSKLDELLSEIYIDQWTPTFQSNYGKSWVSYKELLERSFNEWKYENFEIYNEETEEEDEDLDIELDNVLYDFLEDTSYEIYYAKILNSLKQST